MLLFALLAAATADMPETKAQVVQRARELHARLDTDHDGYVTYEELRLGSMALSPLAHLMTAEQIKATPDLPAMHALFDERDADRDGRISLAEDISAAERTFDKSDTNHDGRATMEENLAFNWPYLQEIQKELLAAPHPSCQPAGRGLRALPALTQPVAGYGPLRSGRGSAGMPRCSRRVVPS